VPTPSPTTSPSSTQPGLDAKALLSDVAHGFWIALTNAPWWVGALFVAVMLTAVVRFVRGIIHGGHPRDAVRRFSQAERRMIFIRAGNRLSATDKPSAGDTTAKSQRECPGTGS
jgi:hypothetical protein